MGGFDETILGYGGADRELACRAYCGGGVLAHIPDADAYHNGPTWAERTGAQEIKNGEYLALRARIPGAADPLCGPYAQHLVRLDTSGWSTSQTLAVVGSLLEHHPTSMRIISIDDVDAPTSRTIRFDGRVVDRPFSSAERRRSLTQTTLRRPVTGGRGLSPLLERVAPGRRGEVLVRPMLLRFVPCVVRSTSSPSSLGDARR